jgi:hypothetical protein
MARQVPPKRRCQARLPEKLPSREHRSDQNSLC